MFLSCAAAVFWLLGVAVVQTDPFRKSRVASDVNVLGLKDSASLGGTASTVRAPKLGSSIVPARKVKRATYRNYEAHLNFDRLLQETRVEIEAAIKEVLHYEETLERPLLLQLDFLQRKNALLGLRGRGKPGAYREAWDRHHRLRRVVTRKEAERVLRWTSAIWSMMHHQCQENLLRLEQLVEHRPAELRDDLTLKGLQDRYRWLDSRLRKVEWDFDRPPLTDNEVTDIHKNIKERVRQIGVMAARITNCRMKWPTWDHFDADEWSKLKYTRGWLHPIPMQRHQTEPGKPDISIHGAEEKIQNEKLSFEEAEEHKVKLAHAHAANNQPWH